MKPIVLAIAAVIAVGSMVAPVTIAAPSGKPVTNRGPVQPRLITIEGALASRLGARNFHGPYWVVSGDNGNTLVDVSRVSGRARALNGRAVMATGTYENRTLAATGETVRVLVLTHLRPG